MKVTGIHLPIRVGIAQEEDQIESIALVRSVWRSGGDNCVINGESVVKMVKDGRTKECPFTEVSLGTS